MVSAATNWSWRRGRRRQYHAENKSIDLSGLCTAIESDKFQIYFICCCNSFKHTKPMLCAPQMKYNRIGESKIKQYARAFPSSAIIITYLCSCFLCFASSSDGRIIKHSRFVCLHVWVHLRRLSEQIYANLSEFLPSPTTDYGNELTIQNIEVYRVDSVRRRPPNRIRSTIGNYMRILACACFTQQSAFAYSK